LTIDNANVKELHDTEGSAYFSVMRQRAVEGALAQAKVECAEARMKGEIGEREKQGLTKQKISQIDAQTAINETIRKKEKASADADFAKTQVELDMQLQCAQINAKRAAEVKDAELQKKVETTRAETEYARLQASDLTKMRIQREKMEQQADAELYTAKKKADAEFYAQQKEAEALLMRNKIEADTMLYAKEKEAEGMLATYQAENEGLMNLKETLGEKRLMEYLMLERATYLDLANANAAAIKGLNPKINIWNTGISPPPEMGVVG
jgi:flotillin